MPSDSPQFDAEPEDADGTNRRTVLAGAGVLLGGGVLGARLPGRVSEGTTFDGLEHAPLGDASLSTSSGSLVTTIADDDGDDGVATDVERSLRWNADMESTIENMPTGSAVTVDVFGTMDGHGDEHASTATLARTSSSYEYRVVYNSTTMSGDVAVEVFDGDESVLFHSVQDPEAYSVTISDDGAPAIGIGPVEPQVCVTCVNRPINGFGEAVTAGQLPDREERSVVAACWNGVGFPDRREFFVEDEGAVGDYVRVIETTEGHDHEVYYTTEVRTTATGLDEVTFDAEAAPQGAMFQGIPNYAGDGATLTRTTDALRVDGGSAVLRLGDAADAAVEFDPFALEDDGAVLRTSGRGTVDGLAGSDLGVAAVERQGEGLTLSADFAALGTDAVELVVLDDGTVAGRETTAAGTVGEVLGGPSLVGARGRIEGSPALSFGVGESTPVALPSGEAVAGARVAVVAVEPASTAEALGEFEFRSEGVGEVAVVGESADPA